MIAREAEDAVQHQVAEYESEAEERNAQSENSAMDRVMRVLAEERPKMERLLQRETDRMQKAYQEELEGRTNEMNLRFASLDLVARQAEESRAQAESAAVAFIEAEKARMEAEYNAAVQGADWHGVDKRDVTGYHPVSAFQLIA